MEEDKVIKTNVFPREMAATMKDGKKVPIQGEVTETFYESGRKDVNVKVIKFG